jgi:hypothetical protein
MAAIDFEQDLEHLLEQINVIQYERVLYKNALQAVVAGMVEQEDGTVSMAMTQEGVQALAKAVDYMV